MRRRTSNAGAGLLALDREVVERYGHLMHDEQRERATAIIRRLDNGEQVEPIPGWNISAWVPGVRPELFYRLGIDDSVVELAPVALTTPE